LQTAIPILLRHLPPKQTKEALPSDGRRILSFTDSRQGTARIAVKLQIENERDYVRSLLYHAIADRKRPANPKEIEKLQNDIATLKPLIAANPGLKGILKQQHRILADLETPPPGQLAWREAQDRLLSDDGFKRWLLPPLQEQSFGLNERQLADLCLWREFFTRPRRQWSLESFGLLRLGYPGIERINHVPNVAAQLQITLDDWRALAQIAVDFFIRQNKSVAIPDDILRWIGYPGRPTLVIGPGQEKVFFHQRPWPSTRSVVRQRSRLVRLLAHALHKDIAQKDNQEIIEELLIALWSDVQGLLSRTEHGYHLDMGQQAEIIQVREAWLCPVTRRLLPATFKGTTPYLPENPAKELAECLKFTMPLLPHPFWLESSPTAADVWLESDARVLQLRALGVWTDLNDRIARFSRYFRSAEHSAQLAGATLTKRESDFKAGKINLLSCSTTMEMGVDIGGLTAVAMHNAPPNPANFLQRAGRAGRRGESVAISFTLCKSTPHGEAVFHNPLWPFTTTLAVPRVSLYSPPIVQRHVNALTLATFFNRQSSGNVRRLTTGWFFEQPEAEQSAPWEKFREWCETNALTDKSLSQGVQMLVRRSVMEGKGIVHLLANSMKMIGQFSQAWLDELRSLLDNLIIVTTVEGNSAAEKAVGFQLQRLRKEYLLSELTTRGFLPGYGFPGGIVPLVTTTAEDFSRRNRQHDTAVREDNRTVRAGYPSRNLSIAIRDYSPGTDTVLDGRVYRSSGITLNWHIPADQEGPPEIQSFRWMWRCETCGGNGTRPTKPLACPQCAEQNGKKIHCYEYLQPSGFAVDIRWHPHNDINTPQYIPVRDPLISMEGAEWVALPSPGLGRYRVTPQGSILHRSDGLHGSGYALCLRCGRAESMTPDDNLPFIFIDKKGNSVPHKRLRGGKNNDREIECPGSHEPWAIKQNVRLGATTRTEVVELQLHDLDGNPVDKVTSYSLGVVLRRTLSERLGVEEREIGVAIIPTRDISGRPAHSIYLFDTAQGGAGYVSQALQCLPDLFHKGIGILQCPRNCDIACQSCLLSYDTQHHIQDLDRHKALDLIDDRFLQALQLPAELQIFGPTTVFEMEPLALALRRERQRIGANEIRVFLAGNANEWEPLAWRLRNELLSIQGAGTKIKIIVPQSILAALEPSQSDELAALAVLIGAEIFCPKTAPMIVNSGKKLPRALEIGNDNTTICWAANIQEALAPTPLWGGNAKGAQFVRGVQNNTLEAIPDKWVRRAISELRNKGGDTYSVSITNEFDGPLRQFGDQAWVLLATRMPELKKKLCGNQQLTSILYSDRYLRSPLSLLLLKELFKAILKYSGGINNDTHLKVTTSNLNWNNIQEPQYLHHDWRDADHRRQIFRACFEPIGNLIFQEKSNLDLPHARVLHLKWTDSSGCTIRLDQGVGYWRTAKGMKTYPFEQSPEKQTKYLKDLELMIETSSHHFPTIWHLSGLTASS
jgi:hypothetical protein